MKRSSWFGLWNNNDKKYMISQTIKINDIKKFVENDNFRIIVKKNKYYKKNSGRPYYCFSIGNCYESSNAEITYKEMQNNDFDEKLKNMSAKEIRDFIEEEYGIKLYTYEECRIIKNGACTDGQRGYSGSDLLVEDYV